MEYYWLIARSITHAQRLEEALKREGISATSVKAPAGLTEKGCAYALKIQPRRFRAAMAALQSAELKPYQIFYHSETGDREVPL